MTLKKAGIPAFFMPALCPQASLIGGLLLGQQAADGTPQRLYRAGRLDVDDLGTDPLALPFS